MASAHRLAARHVVHEIVARDDVEAPEMAHVPQSAPSAEVELRDLRDPLCRLEWRSEAHHDRIQRHVREREPLAVGDQRKAAVFDHQVHGRRLSARG